MALISRRILSRAKMLDFLGELDKAAWNEKRSLYLPAKLTQAEAEALLKQVSGQQEIVTEMAGLITSSGSGAALFWSPERLYLVLPPFPVATRGLFSGFATEPLSSLLKHDHLIALILVRLGAYAIGICHGENLINSKVGTGLVHGRHKKGGSSQARFRRHREKQIEYFLTRVCQHIQEQLRPQEKSLDYLVYGGAWTTILSLQKQCSFLGQLETPALPPLLDIPEPRQAVLTTAVSRVWSSTVIEWGED
jgi:hypothetical protein